MKKNKFVWMIRIIAIAYIIFISIFALDAFQGDSSIYQKLIGFLIHLLPSFGLIICLIIGWDNQLYGGILFLIVAIIFTIFFHSYRHFISFLIISMPPLIIAILMIIADRKKVY